MGTPDAAVPRRIPTAGRPHTGGMTAARRRRCAVDAQPGGAAFGMAVALRLAPVLAARLAQCPALLGRDMAAADAEAGGLAGLAAPAAALPAGPAPGFRIAAAILFPLGLCPGVTGTVAAAMLLGAARRSCARGAPPLQARLAERALVRGRNLAALQTQPRCPAGFVAAVKARKIVPAPRLDIAVSHDGPLPVNPETDVRTPRRLAPELGASGSPVLRRS